MNLSIVHQRDISGLYPDTEHTVLVILCTGGLTCGYEGGDRVAWDVYGDELKFTCTLKRVTMGLSCELIPESATDLNIAMAWQQACQ